MRGRAWSCVGVCWACVRAHLLIAALCGVGTAGAVPPPRRGVGHQPSAEERSSENRSCIPRALHRGWAPQNRSVLTATRDGATPDQPIPSSKFALDDDEEELHPPGMHAAAGRSGGAATGEGLPKEGVYRGGAAGRNTVSLFPDACSAQKWCTAIILNNNNKAITRHVWWTVKNGIPNRPAKNDIHP